MPSVLPITVAFLERLLFDTPPIEALATLSSIWSARARAEVALFGLSEPEYLLQLCLIYSGEVSNGGHSQFFMNRGGRYISDTLNALRAVDLSSLASILEQAAEILSGGVPLDPDEVEAALERCSEERWCTLEELDQKAGRLLPAVDAQLLTYAKANRGQILTPEAPLAGRTGRCAV